MLALRREEERREEKRREDQCARARETLMKKYVRVGEDKIELRTIHGEFTDASFEARKQDTKDAIARVDDELKTLTHAEMQSDLSPLQELAIAEFNMQIDNERAVLQERRRSLKADEQAMSDV
jgi:hypothetical protein